MERFHRGLKEEHVWAGENRALAEARASITRWIEECNHDRPHCRVDHYTPREALLALAVLT
jgi:transposase InsO family protein